MDADDIIGTEDLVAVKASTVRVRRRVLGGTAATVAVASVLVGAGAYFLGLHSIPAAIFVGLAFASAGSLYCLSWWRHYRSIFQQLESLEQRVRSGEVVYGSQVKFHSY